MSSMVSIGAGLALLILGGDALVRGAVAAARRFGVSPLVIGLTLVGFGTSTPELVTSIEAALIGAPGIAVGNVVGSNIANILLILGLAAMILPLKADRRAFMRDGGVLVASSILCAGAVMAGYVARPVGGLFVLGLVAYIAYTYLKERKGGDPAAVVHAGEAAALPEAKMPLWLSLLLCAVGLGLTILGAGLLVDGSVALATSLGVSETVIGLTIVAVGTSMPELVTSVMAAIRRQPDVAFGNIVGSNIYNTLGILGATAVVVPIPVPPEIIHFDIWAMLGVTGLLVAFTVTGWRLTRLEGGVLLALYVAYLSYLVVNAL